MLMPMTALPAISSATLEKQSTPSKKESQNGQGFVLGAEKESALTINDGSSLVIQIPMEEGCHFRRRGLENR